MGLGRLIKQGAAALMPRSALVHGDRGSRDVAITFDDGPHPEQTPRLLEVLARHQVKATFFLQGDHAALWPQRVRDIHQAGHQVANHSYSHIRARARPAYTFVQEIEKTHHLLQDIVGAELTRDFRPPYGDITARTFMTLAGKGYRSVFWTIDSDDSDFQQAEPLVAHVAGLTLTGGDIVLFHEDYAHTVAAMPAILTRLASLGLSARRIDEMASLPARKAA